MARSTSAAIAIAAVKSEALKAICLKRWFTFERSPRDICAAIVGAFALTQLMPTVRRALKTASVIPRRPASIGPCLEKASGVNSWKIKYPLIQLKAMRH